MESLLSRIIADLVMQKLERIALSLFNDHVFFISDDLCAVLSSEVLTFLECFNLFHPRLQLTLEIEENLLNFLDVQMIKNMIKNNLVTLD